MEKFTAPTVDHTEDEAVEGLITEVRSHLEEARLVELMKEGGIMKDPERLGELFGLLHKMACGTLDTPKV
ncbi:MAG: hypothetical protein AAB416_02970 [Patescibacteria group bacterium]